MPPRTPNRPCPCGRAPIAATAGPSGALYPRCRVHKGLSTGAMLALLTASRRLGRIVARSH